MKLPWRAGSGRIEFEFPASTLQSISRFIAFSILRSKNEEVGSNGSN